MRILILGAGAIGGYFGARLQESGADVTWLVRPGRLEVLREQGLRIEGPTGNLHLQVKAVTKETVKPEYDLVMLAPKAYDLDEALVSLAGAIHDRVVLLPVLNGMTHLDQLDRRYGRSRVAGGVANIGAMLRPDGTIVQLHSLHNLTMGPRAPEHEALLKTFFAHCERSNFDPVYTDNIEQQLWNKWVFLSALAASTTLFRGSIGKILATDEGEALIGEMYDEGVAIAGAWGMPIPGEAKAKAFAMLLQRGSDLTSSMYRDLTSGRKTEHEHVLGEICRKAEERGIPAPLMRAAWCHMQVENPQIGRS